jgi:hypothetical protein
LSWVVRSCSTMLNGTPWLCISCTNFWQKTTKFECSSYVEYHSVFLWKLYPPKSMLFCRQLNLQPSLETISVWGKFKILKWTYQELIL